VAEAPLRQRKNVTALYTLTNQYLELAEKLADGDFDAQTIADTIEASGITDELATKAQGIESVARGALAHNDAIDAEIARLKALKERRQNVADGLRKYLKEEMERAGIQKIECPLFTISIAKNPVAVEIYDALSIPESFMRQPQTPPPVIDKTAIKAAIQSGSEISGARLTQSTRLAVK
jgi:hypothetical protein